MGVMFRSKKWLSLVLCFLVAITAILTNQSIAAAEDAEKKETIDYILILDCTVRAVDADAEGVRKAAAKMFVDLIPVDNARIAVFKIGDRDVNAQNGRADMAKSYQLRKDNEHVANALYRMQCIYQLWDLDQSIKTIDEREELKSIIDKAYTQQQGGYSDTHCAAYAAMDTLKYWDSKNACILLVSEEFTASYNEHLVLDSNGRQVNSDHTMWEDVRDTLDANKNWVFNWVDLGNKTPSIRTIIDDLCYASHGETCHDFGISKLPEMIATIVSKYTDSSAEGKPKTLDSSGKATIDLPDFVMLTEANVVVTGDGVESVTVVDGRGSVIERPKDDIWFSTNYDPANRSQFLYTAVKMIRPTSGAWTVNVSGKAGTQVYVQTIHTLEPDIKLSCNVKSGEMIGVGTKLQFVATYQYGGEDLRCGNDAYTNYLDGARLKYTLGSNPEKKIDISNTLRVEDEQYVSDFVVNNRGTYTFYFYIESNDFKSGIRNAKPIENITVENHAPKANGSLKDIKDVDVGSQLDPINIAEHFSDEDGEALTYHIECSRNGRNVEVSCQLHDDGYLSIDVPVIAGQYDFKVYAEDSNGAQSESLPFSLTAVNKAPNLLQKSPMKVRMIADAPEFLVSLGLLPKGECKDFSICLNDVFKDPEGQPMEYVIDLHDTTDTDEKEIVSSVFDKETQALTVSAVTKGKASIFVTAYDSSDATETIEFVFDVRNAGKALGERYWWIPVLIALIILVIAALLASKRVRGRWVVQVDDLQSGGSCTHSFTSLSASRDSKLKKTKVSLLSIVKCAVRLEDAYDSVDFTKLPEKVVVLQGTLTQGRSIKFAYSPVGYVAVTNADVRLEKSGKYVLKRNDELVVVCEDEAGARVLQVTATFR